MNCPARLALLCAVGLVVIVGSRKSGLAEAKPRIMGSHRFVRYDCDCSLRPFCPFQYNLRLCRQLRSVGAGAGKEDPLDQALGSMSTKELYRMLQLLDLVEDRHKIQASAPKDLSRMLELLQMVEEGPRFDQ